MAASEAAAMDTSSLGTASKKPKTEPVAPPGNAPATPQQPAPAQAAPQASPGPSPPGPESFLKKMLPTEEVEPLLYEPGAHPTYLYLFLTKPGGTKEASKWPFTCAADFLPYITGGKASGANSPKVLYVGAIQSTKMPGGKGVANPVTEPDKAVAWDTVAVLEYPPNSGDPNALGAGIAQAVWSAELEPKPYPIKPEDVVDAPDDAWLLQAMIDAVPDWAETSRDMAALKAMADAHDPHLPPDGPANGINLLRFKEGHGQYYARYLHEVYDMIRAVGGHLHFYATIKPKPGCTAPYFSDLLIPYYPDRQAFIKVSADQAYIKPALHRFAATQEAFLPGAIPLHGSLFLRQTK